jgi:hypothetical protein
MGIPAIGETLLAQAITDVLVAVVSAQAAAIVALILALGRLRERITRLEEWVRLEERMRGHD